MKKILASILVFAFVFSGCKDYDDDIGRSASVYQAAAESSASFAVAENGPIPVGTPAEEKKIIKTGRMGIRVAAPGEAKRRVDSLVNVYQGYYAKEILNEGQQGMVLTVRIPGANYEKFIAALESGGGETLYKEISARDVTEEYIDTETRLANKRSYLERYKEILRRAGTIREILEVEEYIRRMEEEIESAEGRLRYLANQAAYSTLELSLGTEYQYMSSPEDPFGERIKKAVSVGWGGIVTFFVGILYLWPLWLAGIIAGIWLSRKKMKRKSK